MFVLVLVWCCRQQLLLRLMLSPKVFDDFNVLLQVACGIDSLCDESWYQKSVSCAAAAGAFRRSHVRRHHEGGHFLCNQSHMLWLAATTSVHPSVADSRWTSSDAMFERGVCDVVAISMMISVPCALEITLENNRRCCVIVIVVLFCYAHVHAWTFRVCTNFEARTMKYVNWANCLPVTKSDCRKIKKHTSTYFSW